MDQSVPKIIAVSINLSKIDASRIVEGKDGAKYLDLSLTNTPDNQFGKDYLVKQDFGKEAREQRIETPILGNAKAFLVGEGRKNGGQASSSAPKPTGPTSNLSDLPF